MKTKEDTTKCMAFRAAFRDMPGVTVWAQETFNNDGATSMLDLSAYINKVEFVAIGDWGAPGDPEYVVFINNPYCDTDEKGFPIFTDEHPNVQWVFGYYGKSFKRALNRAVAIVKARKYPKPVEVY